MALLCIFSLLAIVIGALGQDVPDSPPDPVGENLVIDYHEPGDDIDQQIVGGRNANIRDHPHQVQLLHNGGLRCGGSILSKNYVVTAAHCTSGLNANSLSIRAGSSTKSGGTVIGIAQIKNHPSYSRTTLDYDIAVLRLSKSLTYGTNINKIALATNLPSAGTTMTVTGWGSTRENGPLPNNLQEVQVPFVSQSVCSRRYRLTARMVCAGGNGKDSCSGDSGGPMSTGKRLVGIVSFGVGCARPGYPGVYASAVNLRSWINSNVVFD